MLFNRAVLHPLGCPGSWTSASQNWEVSAFVNNITGELGVRNLDIEGGEEFNYLRAVTTTDPRVYGMSLTYRLNP